MTNEEYIRANITTEELAEVLLFHRNEEEYDYDWDEEPYVSGLCDVYVTSDGEEFSLVEDAIEHEVWWLRQEVNLDVIDARGE